MRVVIRTDASSEIGIGHVMRCLTLAMDISEEKHDVVFVSRRLKGDMLEFIAEQGYQTFAIECPEMCSETQTYDWQCDAEQTIASLSDYGTVDWLIVDHYRLDEAWEKLVKDRLRAAIMVIDDLADRHHYCDLLLDQNYYEGMSERYAGLVPQSCDTLLGPDHVLLRSEFRKANTNEKIRDGSIKRVLVSMGGGDADDVTSLVISALRELDLQLDIVVGASNPRAEEIKVLCESIPSCSFYYQTNRMAELIVNADLAIGAGGVSTWERGALGLPALTIVCADNQYQTTHDLAQQGATINLGCSSELTAEKIFDEVKRLLSDKHTVLNMSKKMQSIMGRAYERKITSAAEYILGSAQNTLS